MKKICITGGAGFIASHLTDHFCKEFPTAEIIVIDRMNYAARREYLQPATSGKQVRLVETSITNRVAMKRLLRGADLVVHSAAESHVDNSYRDVTPFLRNNVEGTVSLLQAAVDCDVEMFIHFSTDEVYGDCRENNATRQTLLNPTNPYSASKAAAEMFVKCFATSYGLRTRVTRANNIYGTRQYPEKLIPKLICDALMGGTFQVHGRGTVQRSFLHVQDFCKAVSVILRSGTDGEIYNVPALREYSVLEVVDMVAKAVGLPRDSFVTFGPDRPHNDSRYGIRGDGLRALGWAPERVLSDDIGGIVEWYRQNLHLYAADLAPAIRTRQMVAGLQPSRPARPSGPTAQYAQFDS
ncbi:MAG: NAD-dependent epimerase/dehydratase family protein [Paracoccaceae bacterium]